MMNERIKELAEQADGQFYEGFAGSTNFVKFAEDDLKKFAELIVRDVLDEVLQAMDDGMDVYDTVADKFGVEE